MKEDEYVIETAPTPSSLTLKVSHRLRYGYWRCIGGVAFGEEMWAQALERTERAEDAPA